MQIIQEIIDGIRPYPPIFQLLGMRITGFCDGCTTIEIDVDERLYNPMKELHGGVHCAIADAAMGFSFFTTLADDEIFTTIDLNISYLKSMKSGKLIAESKIVRRGKRIGYIECDLTNEMGELVAKASSSCIILKRKNAGEL